MKKTMMMIFPLAVAFGSIAQPPIKGDNGQKKNHPMQQNKNASSSQLNLSAEQQKQMKDLSVKYREQLKTLDANEAITVKEQRDRKDKLQRQHRKNMENLLTPEQRKQLSDRKASNERMAKLQGDMQLEKVGSQLKLSADQIAQLQANRTKTQNQVKSIRENDKLDRTTRQKQLEQVKEEHAAALAKVLNQEQLQQFKQIQHKERRGMHKPNGYPHAPMHKDQPGSNSPKELPNSRSQPAK